MIAGLFFYLFFFATADVVGDSNLRQEANGASGEEVGAGYAVQQSIQQIEKEQAAQDAARKRQLEDFKNRIIAEAAGKIKKYNKNSAERLKHLKVLQKLIKKAATELTKEQTERGKAMGDLQETVNAAQSKSIQEHDDLSRKMDMLIKQARELSKATVTQLGQDLQDYQATQKEGLVVAKEEHGEGIENLAGEIKTHASEDQVVLKEAESKNSQQWGSLDGQLRQQQSNLRENMQQMRTSQRNIQQGESMLKRDIEKEGKDRMRDLKKLGAREAKMAGRIGGDGQRAFGEIVKTSLRSLSDFQRDSVSEFSSLNREIKSGAQDQIKEIAAWQKTVNGEFAAKDKLVVAQENSAKRTALKYEQDQEKMKEKMKKVIAYYQAVAQRIKSRIQSEETQRASALEAVKGELNTAMDQEKTKLQGVEQSYLSEFQASMDEVLQRGMEDIAELKDEGAEAAEDFKSGASELRSKVQTADQRAKSIADKVARLQAELAAVDARIKEDLKTRDSNLKQYITSELEELPELITKLKEQVKEATGGVTDRGTALEEKLMAELKKILEETKSDADQTLEKESSKAEKTQEASLQILESIRKLVEQLAQQMSSVEQSRIPGLEEQIKEGTQEAMEKIENAKAAIIERATAMKDKVTNDLGEEEEKARRELQTEMDRAKETMKQSAETLEEKRAKIQKELRTIAENQEKNYEALRSSAEETRATMEKQKTSFGSKLLTAKTQLEAFENKVALLKTYVNDERSKSTKDLEAKQKEMMAAIRAALEPFIPQAVNEAHDLETESEGKFQQAMQQAVSTIQQAQQRMDEVEKVTQEKVSNFQKAMRSLQDAFAQNKMSDDSSVEQLRRQIENAKRELKMMGEVRENVGRRWTEEVKSATANMEAEINNADGQAKEGLSEAKRRASMQVMGMLEETHTRAQSLNQAADTSLGEFQRFVSFQDASLGAKGKTIANDVDRFDKRVAAESKHLSTEIVDVDGEGRLADVSTEKSIEKEQVDENGQFQSELGITEGLLGTLDSMRHSTQRAVEVDEQRWESLKDQTSRKVKMEGKDVMDTVQKILKFMDTAKERASSAVGNVEKDRETLEKDLSSLDTDMDSKLNRVGKILDKEMSELKSTADSVQQEIEEGLNIISTVLVSSVEELETTVKDATDTLNEMKHNQMRFVEGIKKAMKYESNHDDSEIEQMQHNVGVLDLHHTQLHAWIAGFQNTDLIWKKTVGDKMKELGYELDDTAYRIIANATKQHRAIVNKEGMLEDEMEAALSKQRAETNAKMAEIERQGDAEKAKILADESLSEEEKNAAIKKIEERNEAELQKLATRQKEMEMRQMALNRNLAKYTEMVNQAKEVVDRARGDSYQSDAAKSFYSGIGAVQKSLESIRNSPVFSVLQLADHSKEDEFQKASDGLALEDKELDAADRRLEIKINALEKKLNAEASKKK